MKADQTQIITAFQAQGRLYYTFSSGKFLVCMTVIACGLALAFAGKLGGESFVALCAIAAGIHAGADVMNTKTHTKATNGAS